MISLLFALQGYAQKMTVKDSDDHILMEVNDEGKVGSITLPGGDLPSNPEGKLYNWKGSLFWNGSELGTAGSAGGWTDGGANVYTTPSTDLVGIGTKDPEFKLSIDDDGGILAIGKHGSGNALTTAGAGTRLIWYPSKAAFRAGAVNGTQWDDANVGDYSTAMGNSASASGVYSTAMGGSTTASGDFSTAMGQNTIASGYTSTAMGVNTTASGIYSTAMGGGTTASGIYSTAMGQETTAGSYASVAIGKYNVGGGTAGSWVETDPLLEVGIGTDASHHANAVTVLKNGDVGIGTATPGSALEVGGQVKITGGSPGSGKILTSDAVGLATWETPSSGGGGWTDGGANVYTTTSTDKVGIGTSSPEFKLTVEGDGGIIAKGTYGGGAGLGTSGEGTRMIWYPKKAAFRAGYVVGAEWDESNVGDYSVAMGYRTTASGGYSTALGLQNTASGMGSTAMGMVSHAAAYASTAMGNQIEAEAYCSVAIGQYNVGGGAPNYWSGSDPVFEIGIGDGNMTRKNAMTVLQNGNVGIGNATPGNLLTMEESGGGWYSASDHQWHNASSRAIKRDIQPNIMDVRQILDQVEVVNYRYKTEVQEDPDAPYHIGFIADDTPELLSGKKHDGMATGDCIGLLLAAVKEQQKRIESLESEIRAIKR